MPYSHVGIVESVDPKTGAVRILGGNQGRWISGPQSQRGYEFRAPPERKVLDGSAGKQVGYQTSGNLTVDVNAPPGTKVSAEGSGLLQKVALNRRMTQEAA
jgi:hypothetical protein